MSTKRHAIYAAPWAEDTGRADRVELRQYGPTPHTYAKQLERYRLWTWRPSRQVSDDDVAMVAWMRGEGGQLREDVPEGERRVDIEVYEGGLSVRMAAKVLGLSRSSVRTYLKRLRERAARCPSPASGSESISS